jgi:hypothetical protein
MAGDAQAPCVGDALVCGSDAALEVGTPLFQPALDDGRRLSGIGGQLPQKAPLRSAGASSSSISRSPPMVLDRVAAVGDDHHIGGEGGWAENGQGSRQRNGQAKGSPARCEPE